MVKPNPSSYTELGTFLDDRPDFAADWKRLALLVLAGYCVTLGLRLLEIPNWDSPALLAGGERILATHDAYCWLAGAKGVNEYANFGMARLAAGLSSLTGAPLWAVGFWAPPLLGSLTAVAVGLWAWILAGRRAAIAPAFIGALSPGFYYRSRLGYYDSDVFTQLMPLVLGFCLAALLFHCCARSWTASPAEARSREPLPGALPWAALGFGLIARMAHFAHDDVQPLGIGLFWIALWLVAITGLPGRRVAALRLLIVYGLAAYGGPRHFGVEVFAPGPWDLLALALAAGLAALLGRPPARLADGPNPWLDRPWPWLAALVALVLACGLLLPLGPFWAKTLSYFKPVADAGVAAGAAGAPGPLYPGITQSIREAINVADLGTLLEGTSVSLAVGGLSILGILALAVLRPAFLLLLPMTVLGFASLKLGARFTMFGGPVFALGLGIGVHWTAKLLARRFAWNRRTLLWAQALLVAGCLVGYAPRFAATRPTPVLARPHAEALLAHKASAPRDAVVWTWWDFGYATQYYAERMTPSDGGRHGGRDIFATALALTTGSFRQAAQVILLSASQGNNPARRWDAMPAQDVQRELEGLKDADAALPAVRPQHLVVCWENLSLLYWISYYGSWDVTTGVGVHAGVQTLREPFNVDKTTGSLTFKKGGKPVQLASAELLTAAGAQRLAMPENPAGPHLVINDVSRQAMLLDDLAYNSMAVQLLVGDPRRPEQSRHFKLLHEGFPLVRIYEVLPQAPGAEAQAKAKPQ